MPAIGLIPGLVVGLREGIEAALIIGLIVGYLSKTGRKFLTKYVSIGFLIAVVASVLVAGVLVALSVSFEGLGEQLFEGISAILAVAILTFMIFWMMKAARNVREHFEQRVDAMAGRDEMFGLVGLSFVAVFREGLETALFTLGVASATTTADAVAGVAIGIFVAALIGLTLPRLSIRVSFRRFFQVTSAILILIAAGLAAQGIHEFQEAFEIQAGSAHIYNLQGVFSSGADNPVGYLLHGMVGYSDSPSQLEAIAYFAYLGIAVFLWWFVIIRKPREMSVQEQEPSTTEGKAQTGDAPGPAQDHDEAQSPMARAPVDVGDESP